MKTTFTKTDKFLAFEARVKKINEEPMAASMAIARESVSPVSLTLYAMHNRIPVVEAVAKNQHSPHAVQAIIATRILKSGDREAWKPVAKTLVERADCDPKIKEKLEGRFGNLISNNNQAIDEFFTPLLRNPERHQYATQ